MALNEIFMPSFFPQRNVIKLPSPVIHSTTFCKLEDISYKLDIDEVKQISKWHPNSIGTFSSSIGPSLGAQLRVHQNFQGFVIKSFHKISGIHFKWQEVMGHHPNEWGQCTPQICNPDLRSWIIQSHFYVPWCCLIESHNPQLLIIVSISSNHRWSLGGPRVSLNPRRCSSVGITRSCHLSDIITSHQSDSHLQNLHLQHLVYILHDTWSCMLRQALTLSCTGSDWLFLLL